MLVRMRELAGKSRGPLFGLAAGLIVIALGAGWLLAVSVAVFVGVIAWAWRSRLTVADRRHDGYGHHHASGWMAGSGDGFDGGGFDGGGGDGGG